MGNKEIFDRMARQYDSPQQLQNASIILDAIREAIGDTRDKTAMDFGCGTGLIGIALANSIQSMLLVDISQPMLDFVDKKLEKERINNARTLCCDLETENVPITPVDYIIAVQVLLHIKETTAILQKLYSLLNPAGHLLLVDFDKNDAVTSELVHNGFEQAALTKKLKQIGFAQITGKTFFHGKNIFINQDASLFFIDAKK